MHDTEVSSSSDSYLDVLRQHVLRPPSTAIRIAERERAEVTVERDAFLAFADHLERIDVDAGRATSARDAPLVDSARTADSRSAIRSAYRDTVLGVPHYEAEYDEPLLANVAAEFGVDLARYLDPKSTGQLTESVKIALQNATDRAVRKRREFEDVLDTEVESIRVGRRQVTELLDELDSVVIPEWYRETFVASIDEIAAERQVVLRNQPTVTSSEEYTLCDYLYRDEPWTYPVLTAIARFRESVVV